MHLTNTKINVGYSKKLPTLHDGTPVIETIGDQIDNLANRPEYFDGEIS